MVLIGVILLEGSELGAVAVRFADAHCHTLLRLAADALPNRAFRDRPTSVKAQVGVVCAYYQLLVTHIEISQRPPPLNSGCMPQDLRSP